MSVGMLLIFGGGIGFVLFAAAGVVCWLRLRKKGRQLLCAIEKEYE